MRPSRALALLVAVALGIAGGVGGAGCSSSGGDALGPLDEAGTSGGGGDGSSSDAATSEGGGGGGGDAASGGGDAGTSAFPGPSNTGYTHAPGCSSLTAWNGTPIASGQTYTCIDFPGGVDVGSSSTAVTGVTFVGCRFHGNAPNDKLVGLFGDDIAFDYCTFEPDVQPPQNVDLAHSYQYGLAGNGGYYTHVGKLTVTHSDFWGFGNAIDVNPTTDASKPQTYRDNFLHHAADVQNAVYHHDGIGAESGASKGSYVVIDHNTIESLGNTNGVAYQATGPYSHFTITHNLFGGFGYTVAILGGATDVTFTDNTFSTRIDATYGPLYPDDFWTKAGSTWKRNRWSVPSGAAWGNPQHDGWFWVPGAGSKSDDTGFVSTTDVP